MANTTKRSTTVRIEKKTADINVAVVAGEPSEEIVWTALPNGIRKAQAAGEKNYLMLSVFVAPRLRVANTPLEPRLARFDDFLDWPSRVKQLEFDVQFGAAAKVRAKKVTPDPDSDLWTALFKNNTKVESFTMPDYNQRPILDYPVAHVRDFLKSKYLGIAATPETAVKLPSMAQLAHDDVLGMIAFAPHETHVAARDIGAVLPANKALDLKRQVTADLTSMKAYPRSAVANPETDFARLAAFHEPMLVGPERIPITPPELDFHTALSSLGKFPELMRKLGLVIDLEIELASMPAVSTVKVTPDWGTIKSQAVSRSPRTAYVLSKDAFMVAPRPDESDIANGMLKLGSDHFEVITLDVDGAASKAMELANQATAAIAIPNSAKAKEPAGLPSLRTSGISVVRDGRADKTHKALVMAYNYYHAPGSGDDAALFADDVMRGIRVDVWDSASGNWNSLCRRKGLYKFLDNSREVEIEDEGFVSSAVTKAPEGSKSDDPTLRQHQSLFTWTGWSLCAPRPGKTITLKDEPGNVENDPAVNFRLKTSFAVAKGSLPKLRYGNTYRIRARIVDLAGNSLRYDEPDPKDFSLATPPTVYARFEPVGSPALVQRVDPKGASASKPVARSKKSDAATVQPPDWGSPGESVERLVIRSFNASPDLDKEVAKQVTDRHVAPPKSAEISAELHGMFDVGGVPSKASYATITGRDASFKEPYPGSGSIEPAETLLLPYLPDPLALGATLFGLPGASGASLVDYYSKTKWPDAEPFRLMLVEGAGQPKWDASARVLTVLLPKAEVVTFSISSTLKDQNLQPMAIWNWLEQASANPTPGAARVVTPSGPKPRIQVPRKNAAASTKSRSTSIAPVNEASHTAIPALAPSSGITNVQVSHEVLASLKNIAAEGRHWMMTPYRTITLVHAVQQPLMQPSIDIDSHRDLGDSGVYLNGKFGIHGKSTSKVTLVAEWSEPVDPVSEKKWRTISGHASVFEKSNDAPDTSIIYKGERHEFHDTKYRKVRYTPIATTRFREYFPPSVTDDPKNITRSGAEFELDILSSARPAAPKILYVVPTFGWEEPKKDGATITRKRAGGGLRVYLDRPWFSSGDGELLGVVLVPQAGYAKQQPAPPGDEFKPYVTQWGVDPTWDARDLLTKVPLAEQFTQAATIGKNLSISEVKSTESPMGAKVAVAGHKVEYDETRQLWYCDITIDPGSAYYPFIRLALARYQPKSVENAHLSRVVLADFAQLAPDRTAIVTHSSATALKVAVNGTGVYQGSWLGQKTSEVEVSLEERKQGVADDLGWMPVSNSTVALEPHEYSALTTTWVGDITLPAQASPGMYRLVIKEYERYAVDKAPEGSAPKVMMNIQAPLPTDRRLVYADTLILQ